MRRIGDDIYIQRGETWSLDFEVVNEKGHPFALLKNWQNPFLVITVSAALYEQKGDFRESYWLDLNKRWVEQSDGSVVLEDTKKFISTEALYVETFDVDYIISKYGVAAGGKIVLDKTSDFDITNYLFYSDPEFDGNYVYKYVKSYTEGIGDDIGGTGGGIGGSPVIPISYTRTSMHVGEWEEYNFRIIKRFDTKSWMEQGYLYDAKILTGESLRDLIQSTLDIEEQDYESDEWSDEETQEYINLISDIAIKTEVQDLFDTGVPLRSTYDTKMLIIEPSRLYVSVNIQGGVG